MRSAEIKRKTKIRAVNRKRKRKADARNFGEEAERVRAMPCLCRDRPTAICCAVADRTAVEAAHVVARGMGGVNGGRFDIVPLCPRHHDSAGAAGTSHRRMFEASMQLDLRAEADRIAVEHPEPLGIRGLARRWAAWQRFEAGEDVDIARVPGLDELAEHMGRSDSYEREALLGWVRRRMEREAGRVGSEWAKLCSQIQGRALGLAKLYEGNGWLIGEGYFTGEEWVYPACRPDREALAHDVMTALGWETLGADPAGEHGIAWTLCEEAGWPS